MTSAGHSFSDVAGKVVSIINLGSVRAIENMVGAPVHPLRFRANLYVEGWPAGTISISSTRRLPSARRDLGGEAASPAAPPSMSTRIRPARPRHPVALQRRLGHADCGIHAQVIKGGTISADDAIEAEQAELL